MPELPEVEIFKRDADRAVLHKRIRRIRILDASLLKGISARRFTAVACDRRIVASRRHGKYLGLGLDQGSWIMLHFGMTGALAIVARQRDLPRYARLILDLEDCCRIAYVSQRKFGMITAVDDFDTFIESKHLGPDALEIDTSMCRARLRKRRGAAKSALMNQSMIAGIGNIYSDEILFQARIRPTRPMNTLSDAELRTLCRSLHRVLRIAIERHGNPDKMPRTWMLPRRKKDGQCPHCGQSFVMLRTGGRHAYYCPTCQS